MTLAQTAVKNIALGQEYDIYIGRGRGGRWGNPFSHKNDTTARFKVESRERAVEAYREWLWQQLKDGDVTLCDLAELHGKRLGCWCKPQACHGDVLAVAADWAYEQLKPKTQPHPYRVIVCGSRRWQDRERIADRLADLPSNTVIIEGEAAGADRIARQEAEKLGLLVEPHPADWERFGKRAGFLRNEEMAESGAELCIAFWDGSSRGTAMMVDLAEQHGIALELIT